MGQNIEENEIKLISGAVDLKTKSPPSKKHKHSTSNPPLEQKCVNTISAFSADMPSAANSGHPGAPMGCAPMAHLLWSEVMSYSPSHPKWWNRDRFVLSNGHACALQYTMLHLTGYGLSIEDCKKFRALGSKTPGHPENFVTDGVEVSTGPLGQGISNAVGMAMAEKHLSAVYNTPEHPLFSHFTYVICGDGCLQEGVSAEACSLAGHLGLGKLIVLYDDNKITIDGPTDLSFTEDVGKRYEAYGWHVSTVSDVANGLSDLRGAISEAKNVTDKPSLIKIRTVIGVGSEKEGTAKVHGAPLSADDMKKTKTKYGLDPDKSFHIDDDVKEYYEQQVKLAEETYTKWSALYTAYKTANPDKAQEIENRFSHTLPSDLFSEHLPKFNHGVDANIASRKMSSICLNAMAPHIPSLMGGSADLTPSNLTSLSCSSDFQKSTPDARYIRFGVREHGMSAICNGLFAYGGFRPYCATFLNFAGYALGAMRLSALSKFGVIYVMTHDSIGLGEDGPTHQPVEMLESLRSIPNMYVMRPADMNEMNAAYEVALKNYETPSVICCSRSTLPSLEKSCKDKAMKGGYVVLEEAEANLILVATGSELAICVDAAKTLAEAGIKTRVVSMPCRELFLEQSEEYRKEVLPGNVPTLSVEAAAVGGWYQFSHAQIAMKRFGMSGAGKEVFKKFGFTAENVVDKGTKLVKYYEGKTVPELSLRPDFDSFVDDGEGH